MPVVFTQASSQTHIYFSAAVGSARRFVNHVCSMDPKYDSFPGGQPMSLNHKIIPLVQGITDEAMSRYTEYCVSFKADGKRYYMGFCHTEDETDEAVAFTIDRRGCISILHLDERDFVSEKIYSEMFDGCLFDVEIMDDRRTIVVFDVAMVVSNYIAQRFYPDRLEIARHFFEKVLRVKDTAVPPVVQNAMNKKLMYKSHYPGRTWNISIDGRPHRLMVKTLFHCSGIKKIPLASQWLFKRDGLIFTCAHSPFHLYTNDMRNVVKWKPREHITIDFFIGDERCTTSTVFANGLDSTCNKLRPRILGHRLLSYTEDFRSNKIGHFATTADDIVRGPGIYECGWSDKECCWFVVCHRDTKSHPNDRRTVNKTCENLVHVVEINDFM